MMRFRLNILKIKRARTSPPGSKSASKNALRWLRQAVMLMVIASLASIFVSDCVADELKSEAAKIDFNSDIRPILTQHCTACHGGVKQAGGLSFVHADQAMDVIEPFDPECYMIERVVDPDEESRMPPPEHGPRLSDEDVATLKRWIEQGAVWGDHWAYAKPVQPAKPEVSDANWPRQPIDWFVLRKLDQMDISVSPDEVPLRWLRRTSLDLIGLPPTQAEQQSFLAGLAIDKESAYESAVDRLLESPHFGERWASVWLDQVRYADSRGYGEDSPRNIWKYRDWVITAFNQDMPYDEFSIHQLAGDLVPGADVQSRLATAVHRLTQTNEEGGTDDEEFRIMSVIDRVSTTWQTWMGTTYGCVQCHSHPYDPFNHEDFYRFAAYFNNTADCDLGDDWPNLSVPVSPIDYEQASKFDSQIVALQKSIWQSEWDVTSAPDQWQPTRIAKAKTANATKVVIEKRDQWDEVHSVGTISRRPHLTVELPIPKAIAESETPVFGIRITAMPLDVEKALLDAEVGFVMSHISVSIQKADGKNSTQVQIARLCGDEPFPIYDPNESLNPKSKEGFAAFSKIHHARPVTLILEEPISVEATDRIKITIKHDVFDLAAFTLMTRRARFDISTDPKLTELLTDPDLESNRSQLTKLQAQRKQISATEIPVLRERPESLTRPTHLFIGGLFLTKGQQVEPGMPLSLTGEELNLPTRLEMARWLLSDENPLAARVAVNRFWARIFGQGLVTTEEDFGSSGVPPTHPELLDDLSIRFRSEYQWSVKKLLRELVLSRTYRQSSRARNDIEPPDSSNQWLARGPRHSLPAETLRDQTLAISGLLSDKMFGEPVFPPLPRGVWKARRGKWSTAKPGNPDRYRRSIYTHVKRSVPFPMFAAFDAPSRDFCVPKRIRSNTPLQPLMLMNDAGFVECANAFASKMKSQSTDLERQIQFGLERALCRPAKDAEIKRLVTLHKNLTEKSNADVAMRQIASVILNLDEIITK